MLRIHWLGLVVSGIWFGDEGLKGVPLLTVYLFCCKEAPVIPAKSHKS